MTQAEIYVLPQEKYTSQRYVLLVQYHGSAFSGSQIQTWCVTIQSELERALGVLLKKEIKTIFSGRTDTGVHAFGQIAHFDWEEELDERRFLYSLNAILPKEICVKKLLKTDRGFHSQKSAKFRWYRYLINNTPYRSVFFDDISEHVPEELNVLEMNKSLGYIMGRHDFSGFKNAGSDNPAKECEVFFASCREISRIIYIDLIANRFLYNMVRIIVGTLVQIGKGNFPAEHILEALESKDRNKAGQTACARGLILMHVGYDEKIINNPMEAINEQHLFCQTSRS
jgi:tRNA pseudouridine38-40 synthase